MASFIHLHMHSAYSLAEGAIKIKDLVKLCIKQNMPAVAVTDTNNLFGAMEFAVEAAESGIQPIIGVQVNIGGEGHQLVLLVQNEEGYRNLCKLLSDAYLEGEAQEQVSVNRDRLKAQGSGLICLTGGMKGAVNQYLLYHQPEQAEAELLFLKDIFADRLYIEIQRHGLEQEDQTESALINLAYKYDVPLVATNDCYFTDKESYEAHDALLCIAEGRYVVEDERRRAARQPGQAGRLPGLRPPRMSHARWT